MWEDVKGRVTDDLTEGMQLQWPSLQRVVSLRRRHGPWESLEDLRIRALSMVGKMSMGPSTSTGYTTRFPCPAGAVSQCPSPTLTKGEGR